MTVSVSLGSHPTAQQEAQAAMIRASAMLSWNSGVFYNSWLFAMHEGIMCGGVVSSCRESLIYGMVFASIEQATVRGELSFGHFLPPLVCAFVPETAAVMKREI